MDATKAVPGALAAGIGLYGFAKPTGSDGTINLEKILPKQVSELSGDGRSIAVLARAYAGKSIDSEWSKDGFTEPDGPPPFRVKFRARRGWQDTARMTHENDKSIISIHNPYQSGRAQLTRVGDRWPTSIAVQLRRKKSSVPGPSQFRIANGKVGIGVSQTDEVRIFAGLMAGELDLKNTWTAAKFLNGGHIVCREDNGCALIA